MTQLDTLEEFDATRYRGVCGKSIECSGTGRGCGQYSHSVHRLNPNKM
jgi:hypothetical protein